MHRRAGQPPARHLAVRTHRPRRDMVRRTTTTGIMALMAACLIGLIVTTLRADAHPSPVDPPAKVVPTTNVGSEVDGSEDCIPAVEHTLTEATEPCGDGSLMSDENEPTYALTPWPPYG